MKDITINKKSYEGVQTVQIPLSDGSGNANYIDTSGATAKAENIDKGFNAFVDGELVVGTKESADSFLIKMGEYDVVAMANTNGLEVAVIKGILADVTENYKDEFWDYINSQKFVYLLFRQELDKTNTTDAQFYYGTVGYRVSASNYGFTAANVGSTYRVTFDASGQINCSSATFMGTTAFDESVDYVVGRDLVVNQFDKFPSGKVTAYVIKFPF